MKPLNNLRLMAVIALLILLAAIAGWLFIDAHVLAKIVWTLLALLSLLNVWLTYRNYKSNGLI